MKLTQTLLILTATLLIPFISFASCAGKGSAYIDIGIANYTGYPLQVDMSKAAPSYKSSSAVKTFNLAPQSPGNIVWQQHAVYMQTCYQTGAATTREPTITFKFTNADLGVTKPEQKPILGAVTIPLTYSVSFESNRNGFNPEITQLSFPHNIAEEIPGVSPISGVAQIVHANDSNEAIFNIVFYDLAPGVSGNQNVLAPYRISNLP